MFTTKSLQRLRALVSRSLREFSQSGVPPVATSTVPQAVPVSIEPPAVASPDGPQEYERRLLQETERFAATTEIHNLPPIFHYWSNAHLRPMLESFGFSNPDQFYVSHIAQKCAVSGMVRCLSIGAGNCDTEIRIGEALVAQGCTNWSMTCVDLVPEMLERGRAAATASGVSAYFEFQAADINVWDGGGARFDVIVANQCLHHFVELEGLFDRIAILAGEHGTFITSDMIGRNGHQRWPEARKEIDAFWSELPPAYRYNRQVQRQEDTFLDWDCSTEGFEGIRSQDILPLLCERFGFEFFLGFGNLIDPFIDRSFGGNFDPEQAWDRDFIDRVHAADEEGFEQRRLTPTQMLAIMTMDKHVTTRMWRNRSPRDSIRKA